MKYKPKDIVWVSGQGPMQVVAPPVKKGQTWQLRCYSMGFYWASESQILRLADYETLTRFILELRMSKLGSLPDYATLAAWLLRVAYREINNSKGEEE